MRLRRDVDEHMSGLEPPRVVVYVPSEESQTHDALVELTAAGITLRPGHPSHPCNTRLSVVARAALKEIVPDASLEDIVRKVEAGQLNLADLDALAERGAPDLSGLSLVYGTAQPDEITLRFLSDDSKDDDLRVKGAVADLTRLVAEEYGADMGSTDDLHALRARIATHLLVADYLLSTKGAPAALGQVAAPAGDAQRGSVQRIAGVWRNRVDLMESYTEAAAQTETTVDLSTLPAELKALTETETFAANDLVVQRLVAEALCDRADAPLVEAARGRQRTFWGRRPDSNARWQLITVAGELLLECERVIRELSAAPTGEEVIRNYTEGERPWCELDTAQRRLERLYLEFEEIADHPEIEKLVSKARRGYQDAANTLSERFISALQASHFSVKGLRQREIFSIIVRPLLEHYKVAYVLVDAMRYEMGRELSRLLAGEGDVQLSGALASVPTITEIGMASLVPDADGTVEVVDVGAGKLALRVGGAVLRNRAERMAYIEQHSGVPTAILKLEDFQPFRQPARKKIADAKLIVVTSQEIDMVGEADNSVFARQTMSQVLDMILRAVRALAREGVEGFVITADHGHLFGEETLSDMLVDRPSGGLQADLHRRVWVGRGGAVVPNTVRVKATAFGLEGDLDIVTPNTLACFKAPGGNSFFHGGLSPQELIVPVVALKSAAKTVATPGIRWTIDGPRRVTTRVYSVSIAAEAEGLFEIEPPRVRVQLLAAGKKVGRLQDADYGLAPESEDIMLRPTADGRSTEVDHVTFLLEELEGANALEVRLLDARTEKVLAKIENVEVAISL